MIGDLEQTPHRKRLHMCSTVLKTLQLVARGCIINLSVIFSFVKVGQIPIAYTRYGPFTCRLIAHREASTFFMSHFLFLIKR